MKYQWLNRKVRGFLFDVYGVLYDSGTTDMPIQGSIEAIKRLQQAGVPFRLCSNVSTRTPQTVASTLKKIGFDIATEQIFAPIPAVKQYLRKNDLRPYIIVDPDVVDEFAEFDQSSPNCVVLGDAQDAFTYQRLNTAFQLLLDNPGTKLIMMGHGKYYKETDGLKLDVGPFAKALEYAASVTAEVIGKPSAAFFKAAVESMNLTPDDVVMVGDDIISDVGGAQACGIRGIQVRTGKYRPADEPHPEVTPDAYADNLLEVVDSFLAHNT